MRISFANPISACIIIVLAILVIIVTISLFITGLKSPFHYPYFTYSFDVTGKRNPFIEDYIDTFLIDGGITEARRHHDMVQNWKKANEEQIEKGLLKKHRRKQYMASLDDSRAFRFSLTRNQTRYWQRNYVKHPYTIEVSVSSLACDYAYLAKRNEQLIAINYACTLREYNDKNQRNRMTANLRKRIMERDNYTCQICGKYMPDGVGLHIDHIVPISKGGKSIACNLQVLCSKCNGHKSNK